MPAPCNSPFFHEIGEPSAQFTFNVEESHWNVYAQNSSSGAYGIPQALPGSKMASAGPDWQKAIRKDVTQALTEVEMESPDPQGLDLGDYGMPQSARAPRLAGRPRLSWLARTGLADRTARIRRRIRWTVWCPMQVGIGACARRA